MKPAISVFRLNEDEQAAIMRPFPGSGGFNDFMRDLQVLVLMHGADIPLNDAQVGRIFRYTRYYHGDGGAQGRLRAAFGRHLAEPWLKASQKTAEERHPDASTPPG